MFLYKEIDIYSDKIFLKNYGDNIYRLVYIKSCRNKGFEEVDRAPKVYNKNKKSSDTSLARSISHIKDIALCNDFEYFATWTINSELQDRFSLDKVVENMKKDLKAYQRKFKDFKYLYVIEKHENGAFHFHGFIKGVPDSEMILYTKDDYDLSKGNKLPLYIIKSIEKGENIYHINFFDERKGFNTFSKIKSKMGSAFYILKYISQEPVRTSENQIYFRSRGLKMPSVEELKINDNLISLINEKGHKNDFGAYYDFNFNDLDDNIKLDFILQ